MLITDLNTLIANFVDDCCRVEFDMMIKSQHKSKLIGIYNIFQMLSHKNICEKYKVTHMYFNDSRKYTDISFEEKRFGYILIGKKNIKIYPTSSFSQLLCYFPKTITHITFGGYFDQQIKTWPEGVKYIEFGSYFNQNIDDLPDSIIYLKLGYRFKKVIGHYPKYLRHLLISEYYEQKRLETPISPQNTILLSSKSKEYNGRRVYYLNLLKKLDQQGIVHRYEFNNNSTDDMSESVTFIRR